MFKRTAQIMSFATLILSSTLSYADTPITPHGEHGGQPQIATCENCRATCQGEGCRECEALCSHSEDE